MIEYTESLDGITPENLAGFFADWPDPPHMIISTPVQMAGDA